MNPDRGSNLSSKSGLKLVDNTFGPVVDQSTRAFDFTILFEETILSILPSSIFIILSILRVSVLSNRKTAASGNLLRTWKLIATGILLLCSIVLVALWSLNASASWCTQASVPAAILSMLDCIVFVVLSPLEHQRSVGPSLLLNSYLLISILCDAVRTRTLWLSRVGSPIAIVFTINVSVKIVLLVLEECSKRRYISSAGRPWSTEVTSGIFGRTLFVWLDKMIWRGYSNAFSVQRLPDIDRELLSESLWDRAGNSIAKLSNDSRHSLLVLLFWRLKWFLLAPVFPYLIVVASQLAQPYLISAVLGYVGSTYDGSQHDRNIGYGLIAAYGLVYLCIAVATAWGQHLSYRFVVMLRGILVTSIYRKTVSTSLSVTGDAAAVTLMSTDIERIALGMAKIHDAWSTLIQVACAMYILHAQVGVVFVAPLALSLICTLGAIGISSFAGAFQASWMTALEKRVGITSSLFGSIKGVKMLGWSGRVQEIIHRLRLTEIASARKFRLMLLAVVIISFVPVTVAPITVYSILASKSSMETIPLDSNRIFTILSLLSLITQPLDLLFAYIPEILAAVACFSRIEKYLIAGSPKGICIESPRTAPASQKIPSTPSLTSTMGQDEKNSMGSDAIIIRNANFGWTSSAEPVLSSMDLSIPSGKLTVVVGPISSGKSTLLKGILGETPICDGSVQLLSDSIAFCDQNPWLVNETMRSNITGPAHFDASWYAAVVRACALEDDFNHIEGGDQVAIGSNGLSLSGGQKQRVAIARAVYAKRKITLFDDVFSGQDMNTQARIMRDVFGPRGLLRANASTVVLVTHAGNILAHADNVIALGPNGCVLKGRPKNSGSDAESNVVLSVFGDANSAEHQSSEIKMGDNCSPSYEPEYLASTILDNAVDEKTQRLGDGSVYKYYFQTFGWPLTVMFVLLQVSLVFCLKFPEIVLSWWGESNHTQEGPHDRTYLGIFAALEITALIALGLICWQVLLKLAVISGVKLHLGLLNTTLRAPLSFFGSNDIGSIVNRFSQDINLIDSELPFSLINFVCNGLTCIAQALMIIPASAWLLIAYPVLFGCIWFLQRYYLRTSRQLRFLDLDAKSPLYSQFLETLQGLVTIRAFGWQRDLIKKADDRLDLSQKPFYLLYSVQRWLNLVLDLIAALLAIILTTIAVCLRNSTSVGFAGVALFNVMNLSAALRSAITSWTLLETSIGAVARVKRFEESTPDENLPDESQQPPETWPVKGSVFFENVTASYTGGEARHTLSGVSLRISHGEKIGICGRSGSGKSSMLLALFHLLNYEGTITVDNVDVARVSRDVLRERLTSIPQDPVFLAGSVRLNCDPTSRASDHDIIEALRDVKLWEVLEPKGGLDADLTYDNLSKGQQQMFGFARALLNHGNIIVTDEASSSLDAMSEELMMSLMREKFKDRTVIAVAHRLATIVDFDRVVVLEEGRINEVGNPRDLLTGPSAFSSLYRASLGE